MLFSQRIKFKPWIGEQYGPSSQFGMSVLILGESHYEWELNTSLTPSTTVDCVKHAAIAPETRKRFWTRIASAFLGKAPNDDEITKFWHSVAFYNFVQESVGFGAKKGPTRLMWNTAAPAFLELITALRPQLIVAMGERLWDNMPGGPEYGEDGPTLTVNGRNRDTCLYKTADRDFALACRIHHPSKRSYWHYSEWYPWIDAAMVAARYASFPAGS